MKNIYIVIIFLVTQSIYAQFARVSDADGFVNVRKESNLKSEIIGKILTNEIVYVADENERDTNWKYTFYESKSMKEVSGYLHSSRLKMLSDFSEIDFVKTENNTAFFKNDKEKIEVEIAIQSFNSTKNISKFSKKDGFCYAYKNKPMWGTDGGLPNSSYKFVKLKIKGKVTEVPQESLENLFQPTIIEKANHFKYIEINYDKSNDILYISSLNSDGAGSYVVLFVFEKGNFKEIKTVIPY
mgnify:FL=1